MSDPIAYALKQAEAADAWIRPLLMEALIRNGSPDGEVYRRFEATDAERLRARELLARPSVYEVI